MKKQPLNLDAHLLTGFDFRAFLETLRLRWWVIPTTMALSIGFLWAQSSELRTEPPLYSVTRRFEARDPTAILASVGIDPVSVRPFPNANNQVVILQSDDVKRDIATAIGSEVQVNITLGTPSFSLIDTLESDGRSSFIFQSAGVPTYAFSCVEPTKSACDAAIDAYVARAITLRRESLLAGLSDLLKVLEQIRPTPPDSGHESKISAIKILIERLDTPFVEIVNQTESIGPTMTYVRRPTYVFGAVAGFFLSLVILIGLAYSDRKIRSERHVFNMIGPDLYLGVLGTRRSPAAEALLAVSLNRALTKTSTRDVRFVPLDDESTENRLAMIAESCGAAYSFGKPFTKCSVEDLTSNSPDTVDVLVVHRNTDERRTLELAVSAFGRSGRKFGGVILIG